MERLKRRTDFQAAAKGARAPASGFVLQARARQESGQEPGQESDQASNQESGPPRVGFTVSRQVGNAVERNRVRRRLREVVRLAPGTELCAPLFAGHDYVLIGRRAALKAPFGDMVRELDAALRRLHASGAVTTGPLHKAGAPSAPKSPAKRTVKRPD
jgi:ribonuclease P protein component